MAGVVHTMYVVYVMYVNREIFILVTGSQRQDGPSGIPSARELKFRRIQWPKIKKLIRWHLLVD
jgi:hypothetical protein